jgi:hypothetical protein
MTTFNPSPEDWWEATLHRVDPEKRVLTAVLSTDERVHIHEMHVTFSPHGHYFCLPLGTAMSVRIERQRNPWCPFIALEAQFACNDYEPRRERGTVVRWRHDCGGIRRPCKCEIFARDTYENLYIDDEVEYDVSYYEPKGNFIAQNLRKVVRQDAAQNNLSQRTEYESK